MITKKTPHYEQLLQQTIFPDLMRGRPDFDLPHTKAVVYWMRRICDFEPQLNNKVMITAAYAHDWGYVGLFMKASINLAEVQSQKDVHMQVGSKRIKKYLESTLADEFTAEEIAHVERLVLIHDQLDLIHDDDEIALMEADTLGALDVDLVKPTFSRKDSETYLRERVINLRRPMFRHKIAIQWFDVLLQKRLDYQQIEL